MPFFSIAKGDAPPTLRDLSHGLEGKEGYRVWDEHSRTEAKGKIRVPGSPKWITRHEAVTLDVAMTARSNASNTSVGSFSLGGERRSRSSMDVGPSQSRGQMLFYSGRVSPRIKREVTEAARRDATPVIKTPVRLESLNNKLVNHCQSIHDDVLWMPTSSAGSNVHAPATEHNAIRHVDHPLKKLGEDVVKPMNYLRPRPHPEWCMKDTAPVVVVPESHTVLNSIGDTRSPRKGSPRKSPPRLLLPPPRPVVSPPQGHHTTAATASSHMAEDSSSKPEHVTEAKDDHKKCRANVVVEKVEYGINMTEEPPPGYKGTSPAGAGVIARPHSSALVRRSSTIVRTPEKGIIRFAPTEEAPVKQDEVSPFSRRPRVNYKRPKSDLGMHGHRGEGGAEGGEGKVRKRWVRMPKDDEADHEHELESKALEKVDDYFNPKKKEQKEKANPSGKGGKNKSVIPGVDTSSLLLADGVSLDDLKMPVQMKSKYISEYMRKEFVDPTNEEGLVVSMRGINMGMRAPRQKVEAAFTPYGRGHSYKMFDTGNWEEEIFQERWERYHQMRSMGDTDIAEKEDMTTNGGEAKARKHRRKITAHSVMNATEVASKLKDLRRNRKWWDMKAPFKIDKVLPNRGDLFGGTRVEIKGTGFPVDAREGEVAVYFVFQMEDDEFEEKEAQEIMSIGEKSILVVAPQGCGFGPHYVIMEYKDQRTRITHNCRYDYSQPILNYILPAVVKCNIPNQRVSLNGMSLGIKGANVSVTVGNKTIPSSAIEPAKRCVWITIPEEKVPVKVPIVLTLTLDTGEAFATKVTPKTYIEYSDQADDDDGGDGDVGPMKLIKNIDYSKSLEVDIMDLFKKSEDPEAEKKEVIEMLLKNVNIIQPIFYYYAAEAGSAGEDDPNDLTMRQWCLFAEQSKISGRKQIGNQLPMASMDIIFVRANREYGDDPDDDDNDDNALVMHEFFQAIVRVAYQKYPKSAGTLGERIQMLVDDHLIPHANKIADQKPFLMALCDPHTQDMIQPFIPWIEDAFNYCAGLDGSAIDGSGTMNMAELKELIAKYRLPLNNLPETEMRNAFVKSNIGDWGMVEDDHDCRGFCTCPPPKNYIRIFNPHMTEKEKKAWIRRKKKEAAMQDAGSDPNELGFEEFLEMLVRMVMIDDGQGDDEDPDITYIDVMQCLEPVLKHFVKYKRIGAIIDAPDPLAPKT